MPSTAAQARPVRDVRPHRRRARGQARARRGARELPPRSRDRRGARQARSGRTSVGSTTSPSATTASATLLDEKGDRDGALASFREGLAIAKALALRDPDNVQLAVGPLRQPRPHRRRADRARASWTTRSSSYRRGLEIAEALAARDPGARRLAARPRRQLPQDRLARDRSGQSRRGARAAGQGPRHHRAAGRIAAHQAQWRSDLSKFDDALRTLQSIVTIVWPGPSSRARRIAPATLMPDEPPRHSPSCSSRSKTIGSASSSGIGRRRRRGALEVLR